MGGLILLVEEILHQFEVEVYHVISGILFAYQVVQDFFHQLYLMGSHEGSMGYYGFLHVFFLCFPK